MCRRVSSLRILQLRAPKETGLMKRLLPNSNYRVVMHRPMANEQALQELAALKRAATIPSAFETNAANRKSKSNRFPPSRPLAALRVFFTASEPDRFVNLMRLTRRIRRVKNCKLVRLGLKTFQKIGSVHMKFRRGALVQVVSQVCQPTVSRKRVEARRRKILRGQLPDRGNRKGLAIRLSGRPTKHCKPPLGSPAHTPDRPLATQSKPNPPGFAATESAECRRSCSPPPSPGQGTD